MAKNKKTPRQIALERIQNALQTEKKSLGLNRLGLTSLPKEIGKLTKLEKLELQNNKLQSLPIEITKLTKLKSLNIGNNPLTILPAEIFNLTSLQSLIAWGIGVEFLPPEIKQLVNLKELNIKTNNIKHLPPELWELKQLQELDIIRNSLTHLPSDIGKLTNLQVLAIGNTNVIIEKRREFYPPELPGNKNRFVSLPPQIGLLSMLKELDAFGVELAKLPSEILSLKKLNLLDIRDNPLPILPELLERYQSPKPILDYYFKHLAGRTKTLNELKLLFVGQGSVGKTSLVQQILQGTFDTNQTKTEGISINQWTVDGGQKIVEHQSLSTGNGPSPIKLNIWDFGGQEIMHATHQFFLTKRSLYLLVLDARLTQEENRVEYWLKIIQSFGGESPVLIVGNKTDQHPLDIDRTGLQKKYPNIVGVLETSAATGTGIDALKTEIANLVDNLPHVRDLLPETWFTVKSKLEELGRDKNFITQDEYLNLCGANDVTDEISQHTLIGFLHDLGVVLHFQDDRRLAELGILNPQWVTNGVYKILNYKPLFENKGVLTLPLLDEVLNDRSYPKNKRLFIVDMMKKFELCYDIELDKSFLIPDLLPKDEPFTGEWDGALAFQYHYNVLPTSIISRFIVRMNAFIHKTVWRSGVVLKSGSNTALVKADTEDKKIYIWVSGDLATRKEFLAVIRAEFAAIHKTIAKIEAVEKVPLPDAPEATPIDLEFLLRMANEGRESLPVQAGNKIIDLVVKEVLYRIETEKGNRLGIGGGVDGSTVISGNNNVINVRPANKTNKKKRK